MSKFVRIAIIISVCVIILEAFFILILQKQSNQHLFNKIYKQENWLIYNSYGEITFLKGRLRQFLPKNHCFDLDFDNQKDWFFTHHKDSHRYALLKRDDLSRPSILPGFCIIDERGKIIVEHDFQQITQNYWLPIWAVWSPNGDKLLVGGSTAELVYVYFTETDTLQSIIFDIEDPAHFGLSRASWDPDNVHFYISIADPIYKVNAITQEKEIIIENGGEPTISPDGAKLTYTVGQQFFIRDMADGAINEIVFEPLDFRFQSRYIRKPSIWSPDGRMLMFIVKDPVRPFCDDCEVFRLLVYSLDDDSFTVIENLDHDYVTSLGEESFFWTTRN